MSVSSSVNPVTHKRQRLDSMLESMQASSAGRSDFMQLFLLQASDREERRLEREEKNRRELEELRRQEIREREEREIRREELRRIEQKEREERESSVRTNVDKRPERIKSAKKCSGQHCSRNKGYVYISRIIIIN